MRLNGKLSKKILSMTAEAALEAALASVGLASYGGSYQPKEPEMLLKYAEKNSKTTK